MSFQVTNTTETGLSDCQRLISSFMKSYIALNLKLFFTVIAKTLTKKNKLKMSKQQIFLFRIMIQMISPL